LKGLVFCFGTPTLLRSLEDLTVHAALASVTSFSSAFICFASFGFLFLSSVSEGLFLVSAGTFSASFDASAGVLPLLSKDCFSLLAGSLLSLLGL
jgi:hypothetical protein